METEAACATSAAGGAVGSGAAVGPSFAAPTPVDLSGGGDGQEPLQGLEQRLTGSGSESGDSLGVGGAGVGELPALGVDGRGQLLTPVALNRAELERLGSLVPDLQLRLQSTQVEQNPAEQRLREGRRSAGPGEPSKRVLVEKIEGVTSVVLVSAEMGAEIDRLRLCSPDTPPGPPEEPKVAKPRYRVKSGAEMMMSLYETPPDAMVASTIASAQAANDVDMHPTHKLAFKARFNLCREEAYQDYCRQLRHDSGRGDVSGPDTRWLDESASIVAVAVVRGKEGVGLRTDIISHDLAGAGFVDDRTIHHFVMLGASWSPTAAELEANTDVLSVFFPYLNIILMEGLSLFSPCEGSLQRYPVWGSCVRFREGPNTAERRLEPMLGGWGLGGHGRGGGQHKFFYARFYIPKKRCMETFILAIMMETSNTGCNAVAAVFGNLLSVVLEVGPLVWLHTSRDTTKQGKVNTLVARAKEAIASKAPAAGEASLTQPEEDAHQAMWARLEQLLDAAASLWKGNRQAARAFERVLADGAVALGFSELDCFNCLATSLTEEGKAARIVYELALFAGVARSTQDPAKTR